MFVENMDYINIFINDKLTNNEKLLLLDFITINGKYLTLPIQETNVELAHHCSLTPRSVSSVIKSLAKKEIIKIEYKGHFRKIYLLKLFQ